MTAMHASSVLTYYYLYVICIVQKLCEEQLGRTKAPVDMLAVQHFKLSSMQIEVSCYLLPTYHRISVNEP